MNLIRPRPCSHQEKENISHPRINCLAPKCLEGCLGEHLSEVDQELLSKLMKDLFERGSTIDTTPTIFWRMNTEEENKVETYDHAEMPLRNFRQKFGQFRMFDLELPKIPDDLPYQMRGSETTNYFLSGLHALVDKEKLGRVTGVEILEGDFAKVGHFRHELQEFPCSTYVFLERLGLKIVEPSHFMEKQVAYTVGLDNLPVLDWCGEFHEEVKRTKIGKYFSFDPGLIPAELESLTVKGKADMLFLMGDLFGVYDFKRLYGGYYPIEKVSKQVSRYIAGAAQMLGKNFPGFVRISAHTRLNQEPGWHAKPLHHIVYYPRAERFYNELHRNMLRSSMIKFELLSRGEEFYLGVLDRVTDYLQERGVPEYDLFFSSPYSWYDYQDGTCRAMRKLINGGGRITDVLLPNVKLV